MATIKLQPSGAVVIKDGKVNCACCGCNPIYTTTLGPFLHGSISDLWSKEKLDAWANSPFTVNIDISVMGRSASLSVTAPVVCKYDYDSTYADYFNDWETVLGPVCDDDPECGNYYKYESLDMTLTAPVFIIQCSSFTHHRIPLSGVVKLKRNTVHDQRRFSKRVKRSRHTQRRGLNIDSHYKPF